MRGWILCLVIKKKRKKDFKIKSDDNVGFITLYTVVDVETGVNYLITISSNGISTTLLYDVNGNILVDIEYYNSK